jgi:hypothetical protein
MHAIRHAKPSHHRGVVRLRAERSIGMVGTQ